MEPRQIRAFWSGHSRRDETPAPSHSRKRSSISDQIHVALFASGNLAAETIVLVQTALANHPAFVCTMLTDGYHPTCDLDKAFQLWPSSEGRETVRRADILLTSIRSPGTVERALLAFAQSVGTPQIVLLADLGTGPSKFREGRRWVLPDIIAVADATTERAFVEAGVDHSRLRMIGSPYLDSFLNVPANASPTHDLAFFSVPNELDFDTWGIAPPYLEADVLDELRKTQEATGRPICVRAHPKELGYLDDIARWRGFTPESCLSEPTDLYVRKHRAVISTYSTALLVGRMLERRAISLQPKIEIPVRQTLYQAWKIPIVQTAAELVSALEYPPSFGSPPPIFNAGHAIEALIETLLEQFRDA